jgi:DNA-binding MarR family transcriptional regulator
MRTSLPSDPIAEATRQWIQHGWEEAAAGMSGITSLMRAHQIALARVERVLQPFSVTFARYEVLMLLHFSRNGSLPMRVIGSLLQVHQTSVTNAVDRLEGAKLVRRLSHPTDRRATLIELTVTGRKLALKATAALNNEVFSKPGIAPENLTHLIEILGEFRRDAGDFTEKK